MLSNISALFFLLPLCLCSDLKVESIPNEIHVTFIYHNGSANEYEAGRNQRTPFPHVTSSVDERIVSLLRLWDCPFSSFSPDTWYWLASRCLAVVIWCSLADECVQAHCSSQLWLEILLRLPVCSERVKSFVHGALCCIPPRSFLFRLLECAVLACILPACLLAFPFCTVWNTECCVILIQ